MAEEKHQNKAQETEKLIENVLTADDMLYFIDTVFFIKPDEFWDEKPATNNPTTKNDRDRKTYFTAINIRPISEIH
jgi:hypothetical protein